MKFEEWQINSQELMVKLLKYAESQKNIPFECFHAFLIAAGGYALICDMKPSEFKEFLDVVLEKYDEFYKEK